MNSLNTFMYKHSLRRMVSMLLLFCMTLVFIPVANANVAMPLTAQVIGAIGHTGETVSVAVYMQPGMISNVDDAFWKYSLKLNYDANVLTDAVVKDTAQSANFDSSKSVTGSVYVEASSFGNLTFIDEPTRVFTVDFKIKDDALLGETNIQLDSGTYTLETTDIAISTLIPGKVTVVNDAPTADQVTINGTPVVGTALTGDYVYKDTENNAEAVPAFKWYQASSSSGTDKTVIDGATAKTFTLTSAQLDKYIFFEVTPAAQAGIPAGLPTLSEPIGPVTRVAQTAVVKIGSLSAYRGSTITVPVSVKSVSTGVSAYGMRIHFDSTALKLEQIIPPSETVFSSTYSNDEGWVRTAWSDATGGDQPITVGKDLFKLVFKVSDSAEYGARDLTVENTSDKQQFTIVDTDAEEMTSTLEPGIINITKRTSSSAGGTGGKEIIKLDVAAGGSKASGVVSSAVIERTAKSDGTKSDKVTFATDQAQKAVDSIKQAGASSANILIPDAKDEVSEVEVTVPKESGKLIADAKIDIGLMTDNVHVNIPNDSLQGFTDDLYFHFVPIKNDVEKQDVKDRANKEALIKNATGAKGVTVVGRPMTIETNLQNRQVTLVMPLKDVNLSEDELAKLGIYVEHSDGTKELLSGKLVNYDGEDGGKGFQFSVHKFSTFSLVHLEGKPEAHTAYVNGYEDGTFRPDHSITRAEMAAILSRVAGKSAEGEDMTYSDVSSDHWASAAISQAAKMKLMSGYPDGSFKPDQPITRAEMAALSSLLITGNPAQGTGFDDISSHWAEQAILAVQGAGIIQGYEDGSYRPDQYVTRAETVVIMNKLLVRGPSDGEQGSVWKDVESTNWALKDIQEASVEHYYVKNQDGNETWIQLP
ncbi:S-layer homology domain-containing protein [Paenibacillus hexagrammi]|uniref:S-layer homology domain-containing protein n=1 Tax=Paenibacillus hexagrammi TaxID=2908839 RepID=A0ABY3SGD8_9BACL|nr:S-layer homology domain-containing protein [Paenibacillus sp. YPD9-1]UJF32510.1 S-layer homology domain-containing protein [Paenibacillus sp. YPD9-1]